jgi:hypothetical protein
VVCTPRGTVTVDWRVESGRFVLAVEAPRATPVHVRLPNGERHEFSGGRFSVDTDLP